LEPPAQVAHQAFLSFIAVQSSATTTTAAAAVTSAGSGARQPDPLGSVLIPLCLCQLCRRGIRQLTLLLLLPFLVTQVVPVLSDLLQCLFSRLLASPL
jgi:hypothetical protein